MLYPMNRRKLDGCAAHRVALPMLIAALAISSVASAATLPTAMTRDVKPLNLVDKVNVTLYDRATIDAEDIASEQAGDPPRFAIPQLVTMTPINSGTWEDAGNGEMLWRLNVEASEDTTSLNFGFSQFKMPEGGKLFIYSNDFSEMIRPFTIDDVSAKGELWTPVLPGHSAVIEVTIPTDVAAELELELASINMGYRGFGDKAMAAALSGSCNVDTICPEGDGWRDQIQSSAVYTVNGIWTCSGAMINNTSFDQTPYFLTANHCGVSTGNDQGVVIYFNYFNSTCRPVGSGSSGGAGDGSLSQFHSGTIHRASYSGSDFTLLELDSTPDPAFEIYYSGWDRTGNATSAAIAIHHPSTDEKRISFENDPTTTTSYLSNSVPGDGTHVRVTDWDLGTTEPGSSGSPLYDPNHRIIGQLHGGYAACGNNDSDWYGRVSRSWTGGGSSSSRLSDWLDPLGTAPMAIDGTGLAAPPVTNDIDLQMIKNNTENITLDGFEPNMETLDYIITSLPSNGSLSDPGAGAINSVPYTLVGNGDVVDYTPSLDYVGNDAFSYKANDGNTPPDGGDSNTSTVTVEIIYNPPVITTASLPNGVVGVPYGPLQYTAFEGQPALSWELLTDVPYFETDLGTNGFAEVGVAQDWHGDDIFRDYTLPFTFNFYGVDYDEIRVWSNGMIDFLIPEVGSGAINSVATLIKNGRIAPLWDDLVTSRAGEDIFVDVSVSNEVTVRWKASTYNGAHACQFSVTLHATGEIDFHYGPGNSPITATVGISAGDETRYTISAYDPATNLGSVNSVRFKQPDQLPPGMSINGSGVLSGTPTVAGDYIPTVRVTDSFGRTDQVSLPLTVLDVLGDVDNDGDVDSDDFVAMIDCMTGPNNGPVAGGCSGADMDIDDDVDLEDAMNWMTNYTP